MGFSFPQTGGGGGGAGSPMVRKFPFAFDTPDILTGAALYTPTVGDLLLDLWVEITTQWDGFGPTGDIGQFLSGATTGWFQDITAQGPLDMTAADSVHGGSTLLIGQQMSALAQVETLHNATEGVAVVSGAAINFNLRMTLDNGTRFVPAKFTTAAPIKFVVSRDGTTIGTDPGSTQGAAILYLVTATPA